MANSSVWYTTSIPEDLVKIIEKEAKQFDKDLNQSTTFGGTDLNTRDSKTSWIPSANWIVGLCYHHVLRANRENFLYDIVGFDGEAMQYTSYEKGEYYTWHNDAGIESAFIPGQNPQENFVVSNTEKIRKLSVVLQLSDPDDYEGGEMQLMSVGGKSYFLPKTRGSLIVFDSRTPHRVKKIISGHRKSLVGWVVGPRWK